MRILCAFLFILSLLPSHVRAEGSSQFKLDKSSINITTGFNGSRFSIYGTKQPSEDVIVVVRGPERHMKVRYKQQVMKGWINNSFVLFDRVPSFYRVAASKDMLDIVDADSLADLKIGVDYIDLKMRHPDVDKERYSMFRSALIRNKVAENLMSEDAQAVEVLNDRFIRATFFVPHNVALGLYDVQVLYFDDGVLSGKEHETLEVKQVGMNSSVLKFAHEDPLLYGIFCVFLAIFAGWLSNRLKRAL